VTVTDSNNKTSDANPPADSFTYLCAVAAKPCIPVSVPAPRLLPGGRRSPSAAPISSAAASSVRSRL
jgi:hypothetical protein